MKKFRLDGVVGVDIKAADIAKAMDGQTELDVTVNSGGGDIMEGLAIFNLFNDFDGSITFHVDFAASMMSIIVMAGDKITMSGSSSIMMIHRPWGGTRGRSESIRAHADTLDKLELMMLDLYEAKTGMNRDDILAMLEKETYMNAKEAHSMGFIDSVDSGGKLSLSAVAMAGMQSVASVDFDAGKLVAKIKSMESQKSPVRDLFNGCETLAKVESVMRQELKLSQSEATAIVAAVKHLDRGDRDQKEAVDTLKSFKFSF